VEYTYVDEGTEDPGDAYARDYDLVGITTVTSSAPRAYRLSKHFRARGIPVVLGGTHATLMAAEAAENADAVVCGAGDVEWGRILREVAQGCLTGGVRNGGTIRQPKALVPDRSINAGKDYMRIPTLMASRGCRNSCSFCSTSQMWGNSGPRPLEDVVEELRSLAKETRTVIFLDSNFVTDRDFALELMAELRDLRLRWGALVTSGFMHDAELVEAASRAGCVGVLVGFESVNQDSLDGCRKSFNSTQRYIEGVRNLHSHGLSVLATMVVGFDCDGLDIFDRTVEFVRAARLDTIHYTVLTPFPGTRLFSELEGQGRILTRDWALYDTIHAVFQPALMSPEALEAGYRKCWRDTYRLPGTLARLSGHARHSLLRAGANLSLMIHTHELLRCYENSDDLVLGGIA
jgi:radical SAM superfamily enzyme YgiQ (UPF0313 family)